jgi:hypothetical protein
LASIRYGLTSYNIEPAALIMAESAQRQETSYLTATLLEFLYLMAEEYAINRKDSIRSHIKSAHIELLNNKIIKYFRKIII